jgi:3-methyladenine DNA glycosylase AlkD
LGQKAQSEFNKKLLNNCSNMTSQNVIQDLNQLKNPQKAQILQRFFKTGKGQYGEGDQFLGITVPIQRQVAIKYQHLTLEDIEKLLKSPIHEYRLTALLILTYQFEKSPVSKQKQIFKFYLKNTKYINNWDLVDATAHKIVGKFLLDKNDERKILYKLARSQNLWEKRVSIVSTFAFIKNHDFTDSFNISQILLLDPHDLIHKAVGWMLREIGKIDQVSEEKFLMEHFRQMPRTMLRYAIEKFDPQKRQFYLQMK